jgi:hypothetical protein
LTYEATRRVLNYDFSSSPPKLNISLPKPFNMQIVDHNISSPLKKEYAPIPENLENACNFPSRVCPCTCFSSKPY